MAALAPALAATAGLVTLTQWDPGTVTLRVAVVLGGIAAVVVGAVAWRRGDRVTLGFALACLCAALAWVPLGPLSFPVSTIVGIAAEALLIAFGVLLLRRETGWVRVAGWVVTVGGTLWLLGGLAVWIGTLPRATETTLVVLFTVPALGQLVAFAAAAALFVGPLVRPVHTGARYLWSTADVR